MSDAIPTALKPTEARARRQKVSLGVYLELAKARLCALVLLTTFVGFVLASGPAIDWWRLLLTLIGTGLAAFGANAYNQCLEAERDALMERTRNRPLPSGRISPRQAKRFATKSLVAGPLVLALLVNPLTALLALLTEVIYVWAYTPLKTRSPLNTLVGAVVGAIPPMIGWAAVTGGLEAGAWLLAGILFFWQMPHFMALAWMYRDDYDRGGFCMLPSLDQRGTLTCNIVLVYTLALAPLGLSLTVAGLAGPIYGAGAAVLAVLFALVGWKLHLSRRTQDARRVFLASVIYLPLLIGLVLLDRKPQWYGEGIDLTATPTMQSDTTDRS